MTPLFQKAITTKIIIGSLLVGGISVALLLFPTSAEKNGEGMDQIKRTNEAYEVTGPLTIDVILKRHYLDGAVSEEIVQETIWSMEDFWSEYEGWQLVDQYEGEMVFKQDVDDISPLLKADGYFGISQDGTLTIYKGKPGSEEVIQSFFQIDVDKLESRQQMELEKGIPVVSKARYQEVIESFKVISTQQ